MKIVHKIVHKCVHFLLPQRLLPTYIYYCPQMDTDRHGFSHALRWCWLASRYTCLTQISQTYAELASRFALAPPGC